MTSTRRNGLAGWWPARKVSPPPPCDCGHPDSKHLGLTGPCLAAGADGALWADTCKRYRPER